MLVEIAGHGLGDRRAAGAERRMAEGIFHVAQIAHVKPFADDHDAAAVAPQLVVDMVGQLG